MSWRRLVTSLMILAFAGSPLNAADQSPAELAAAYRNERQAAVASRADRLLPAFPISRADEVAGRAELAAQAGRNVEAARLYAEARRLLPTLLAEPIPHLSKILGNPRLKHGYWVSCVGWNEDGSVLATGGHDARVKIWSSQTGQLKRDYSAHSEPVRAVEFLPGGNLASAAGKEIRIWSPTTGVDIKTLATSGNVKALAVNRNGKRLAAAGDDRSIQVWDIEAGKVEYQLGPLNSAIESVTWSPKGDRIAASASDGSMAAWDVENGKKKLLDLRLTSGSPAFAVSFAPDGNALALCGDRFARIFALPTRSGKSEVAGSVRRSFEGTGGHSDMVTCLAYSPDGKLLATAGRDNSVRLWDVNSGQRLRTLVGHTEKVNAVRFAPDGTRLASVADDQSIRIWDLAPTPPAIVYPSAVGSIWTLAVSLDGSRVALAGADRIIRIGDATTGKEIQRLSGHAGAITAMAWSADGRMLISAAGDKSIRFWDPTTGQAKSIINADAVALTLGLSPDGQRLAVGGGDRVVRLFDVATSRSIGTAATHAAAISTLAWRPVGDQIASASVDGNLKVWDVAANKELLTARVHDQGGAACLAYSPDGQSLFTCGGDGQIKIWKLTTPFAKEPIAILAGHTGPITSLCLSADGRMLASGGADEVVKVWDVATRIELFSFAGHGGWVTDVKLSPNSKWLVSADVDGKVLAWALDSTAGNSQGGHSRSATAIAAAPGILATGGQDRIAVIWDLVTGRERLVLPVHGGSVIAIALSAAQGNVATAAEDRRLRVFDGKAGNEIRGIDTVDRVPVLAISSDGKRILVWQSVHTSSDDEVSSRISQLVGDAGPLQGLIAEKGRGMAQCLAFSSDQSLAAVGATDGKLHVWKIGENKRIIDDRIAHSLPIADIAVTPDNRHVISIDDAGEAKVWSINDVNAEPVAKIKTGTGGKQQGLAVSPDSRRFAAFGSGRELAVFDAMSGQLVRRWRLPQQPLAATFTTDGKQLATANDDGTVYVLDLP